MPNKPKTPIRSVRVDSDLWAAASEIARLNGTTPSDVMRDALRRYVRRHRPTATPKEK